MRTLKIHIIALLAFCFLGSAQQTPASKQQKTVAIVGATVHTGTGRVLENSLIIFDQGTLQYVGAMDQGKINSEMDVINARKQHVYPGFIIQIPL